MSCICENHKEELKSLSNESLESKITDEGLKMYRFKQLVVNQQKIIDLLHNENNSRVRE